MRKIAVSCCLFLLFNPVWAQKINLDSLAKVAITLKATSKTNSPINPKEVLAKLFTVKSPPTRIRMVYDIILLDQGELDPAQSLFYRHKILDLARKYNDVIIEAIITAELGYAICEDGDNTVGFKMILSALKLAEKTGNKQAIGIVYDNLGVCYAGAHNIILDYYKKALRFSTEAGDSLFTIEELGNLSQEYQQMQNLDSARYYLARAFELAIHTNNDLEITSCLSILGLVQTSNSLKLKYYNYALITPMSERYLTTKGGILMAIAGVYRDEGKIDSALSYARTAYNIINSQYFSFKIAPAYLLAQLYTGKNADSALKYTKMAYTIKDSVYSIKTMKQTQSMAFADQQRQQETMAQKKAYQNALRTYLLMAVIIFSLALAAIFWRNNRQNKKARIQIQDALEDLKSAQTQLIQSAKMASLGELTAGIAHEIQNPLNFVNNFSEVSVELLAELKEEEEKGNKEDVIAIADDLTQNLEKIRHHGKRADAIVKGMLQHSQSGNAIKEPTNINALADEYLRLAYHGLRAKDKDFNADLVTNFDQKLPKVNVIPQDIGRVLLNLLNNAFYAVNQKQKTAGEDYKPEVSVSTSTENGQVVIKVKDNGLGIPDAIKEKIMQPFFTTKPTGEGTGLGLSLTYDMVVKGHGGSLEIISKEGEGAEFIVKLPLK